MVSRTFPPTVKIGSARIQHVFDVRIASDADIVEIETPMGLAFVEGRTRNAMDVVVSGHERPSTIGEEWPYLTHPTEVVRPIVRDGRQMAVAVAYQGGKRFNAIGTLTGDSESGNGKICLEFSLIGPPELI
jgi:hypothetical protein